MNVTFEIPDPVAEVLGYAIETLPRRSLEAMLVDECVRGKISRGKVAEVLGLPFHDDPFPQPGRENQDRLLLFL